MQTLLTIIPQTDKLFLNFSGELTVYSIDQLQNRINTLKIINNTTIIIDLCNVEFMDTSAALFIDTLQNNYKKNLLNVKINSNNEKINETLGLIKNYTMNSDSSIKEKIPCIFNINKILKHYIFGLISFIEFLGELFMSKFFKNFRYKEILFEINESGLKALWIVALTSFLIGVVVAYQSSYQLKIYGANIFIVDMLGISILRELAPLMTAIVIAGRSGSSFTAQIGAMKITQELDAMKTMGFDPFTFLVMPRIIALMIVLPILVFISDIMALLGGMIVANIDLGISVEIFTSRFQDVINIKHFYIGIFKAPFFAFLIASIGIYRGLMVKDDTQSIGQNTTKSVVESIFAVIVCDAFFSIAFTSLGI